MPQSQRTRSKPSNKGGRYNHESLFFLTFTMAHERGGVYRKADSMETKQLMGDLTAAVRVFMIVHH